MKKLVLIIAIFLIGFSASAQDAAVCERIVLETYNAINQKNADLVMPYLADDFSIAGHSGEIARMILPQLFMQLNIKVTNIKKVSELKTDVLTLTYEAAFEEKGVKASTFIFNSQNQLQSLELLPMQVMTKEAEAEVEKDDQAYFTLPFKRIGNLIAIEVQLNGVSRTFLLDNGAPVLVLNSAHIASDTVGRKLVVSGPKGAGGAVADVGMDEIESFTMGGISMGPQKVVTVDLGHLEEQTEMAFHGLLGYELYKDYDLLFDYKKNTITFIKPEATAAYVQKNYKSKKPFEADITMESHLAVVKGVIYGKTYAFGIDCGAETNLFDIGLQEAFKPHMTQLSTDTMLGADKNAVEIMQGKLKEMVIGGVRFKKTETAFSDISHLNEGYQVKLDGLIGYGVLSDQPTLLSYQNKKIIFLR